MGISSVTFDKDLYDGGGSGPDRFPVYDTSIPDSEDDVPEDERAEPAANPVVRRRASYKGHARGATDIPRSDDDGIPVKKSSASSTASTTTAGASSTASSRPSATTPGRQRGLGCLEQDLGGEFHPLEPIAAAEYDHVVADARRDEAMLSRPDSTTDQAHQPTHISYLACAICTFRVG
jgi:hypothetical protein